MNHPYHRVTRFTPCIDVEKGLKKSFYGSLEKVDNYNLVTISTFWLQVAGSDTAVVDLQLNVSYVNHASINYNLTNVGLPLFLISSP